MGAESGTLTISGVIRQIGGGTYDLVSKPQTSTSARVVFAGANTWDGFMSLMSGTSVFSSLNSVRTDPTLGTVRSPSSNMGAPTTVDKGYIYFNNNNEAASLVYTGTGEVTDRTVVLMAGNSNSFIEQSGSGLLKFISDLKNFGTSSNTLYLQGSTAGAGEISGSITNPDSGFLTLVKQGTGRWTISGSNSYSGTTTISDGTLGLGHASALGSSGDIVFSGGTLQFGAANTSDYASRIVSSGSAIALDTNGQDVTFAGTLAASNTGGLI